MPCWLWNTVAHRHSAVDAQAICAYPAGTAVSQCLSMSSEVQEFGRACTASKKSQDEAICAELEAAELVVAEGETIAVNLEPPLDEVLREGEARLKEKGTWKLWQWPLDDREFFEAESFRCAFFQLWGLVACNTLNAPCSSHSCSTAVLCITCVYHLLSCYRLARFIIWHITFLSWLRCISMSCWVRAAGVEVTANEEAVQELIRTPLPWMWCCERAFASCVVYINFCGCGMLTSGTLLETHMVQQKF